MHTPKNTRIAPSPTGLFHIGTARTAYHNYLASRATQGKFILRIDDTDEARNTQENVDLILKSMEWLKLDYDALFYQSKRMPLYKECLTILRTNGFARTGDDGELRLRIQRDVMPADWEDTIIGKLKITDQDWSAIENLVIARKDGSPVYQFATVVDDMAMGITDVIRGADHTTNTPKQLAIRLALQLCNALPSDVNMQVKHSHVGLITLGNAKISKRKPEHASIASLQTYIDKGYHPDALLNYLLRLGWSPKEDNKENSILNRDRAKELFLTAGNLKNSAAKFDQPKLDWFQKVYSR